MLVMVAMRIIIITMMKTVIILNMMLGDTHSNNVDAKTHSIREWNYILTAVCPPPVPP